MVKLFNFRRLESTGSPASNSRDVVTTSQTKGGSAPTVLSNEGQLNLSLKAARRRAEHEVLVAALCQADGKITRAAELVGISRAAFYDLIKRHNLGSCITWKVPDQTR